MAKQTIAVAVCLVFALMALTVAVAADDEDGSARGAGTYVGLGDPRTFSFNVFEKPDGEQKGHAQFRNRTTGSMFRVALEYLEVEDENVAYACGTITEYSAVPGWVGTKSVFRVVDNGQRKSDPDQISLAFGNIVDVECGGVYTKHPDQVNCPTIDLVEFFIHPVCGWPGADVLYDLSRGNIKVETD